MRVQSSRKVDDSIGTSPKKKQRSERDPCTEEGQVEDEPVVSNETGFGTGLGVGAEEGQAGIEPVVSNGAGVFVFVLYLFSYILSIFYEHFFSKVRYYDIDDIG